MNYILRCIWSMNCPEYLKGRKDFLITQRGYETLYGEDGIPATYSDLNKAYQVVEMWEQRRRLSPSYNLPQYHVEELP